MFILIVAYVFFGITSLFLIAFALSEIFKDRETERLVRNFEIALKGRYRVIDWNKIGIVFVVWFVSGWYIWG